MQELDEDELGKTLDQLKKVDTSIMSLKSNLFEGLDKQLILAAVQEIIDKTRDEEGVRFFEDLRQ